jgi:hypothetical protein
MIEARRGRVGVRPKALGEADLKKARVLLRSGEYTRSRSPKSLKSAAIRSGAHSHGKWPNDKAILCEIEKRTAMRGRLRKRNIKHAKPASFFPS